MRELDRTAALMATALVWFRRDLRLTDNPALGHALHGFERIVPVYVHAPDEETPWAPGGAQRVWLHFSLSELDRALRELGSRLVVREGPTLDALRTLIKDTGAEAVFWNRLYEPAVIERDTRVKAALRDAGIAAGSFNGALLAEPWTVATGKDEPYRVFTPFWRNLGQRFMDEPAGAPAKLPNVAIGLKSEPIEALELLPRIGWDGGIRKSWTPGESGALECVDAFCDSALHAYKSGRDRPDQALTSRLSPHLHHGEISPRQVWHAVAWAGSEKRLNSQSVNTFQTELGWREFAHHVLYHFPETPEKPLNPRFEQFPWVTDYGDALRAWQRGRTGIPMVDAGMRELWHTGWMHNRVRMTVASFLTKNLLIPWQDGARWFWDTLVDADLANNTLGWQWASGSGADAAPYFRIFNPVRQGERFDPEGSYVRHWVPELAAIPDSAGKHVHAPADGLRPDDYPRAMVDLKASRERALVAFERIKS